MNKTFFKARMKTFGSLQGILWSKNIEKLDFKKDKIYIIHQILSYGSLKQIKWAFKIYGPNEIREVFLKYPKKIYTAPVFHFVKNFILNLRNENLSLQNYVKTALRASK